MSNKRFLVNDTICKSTNADGVVTEFVNKKELIKVDVEPFFFTYSKQICALYSISIFNATTKVLWKLLEAAEWNTGEVYMNSERRQEIMQVCNISRPSFDRAIRELVDNSIIEKHGSKYIIDAAMFWKGDKASRDAIINKARMKVSFETVFDDPESLKKKQKKINRMMDRR